MNLIDKTTLATFSACILLSACSGHKTAGRNILVSDEQGIMSKTEAIERELNSELTSKRRDGSLASGYKPQPADESVKSIKQTSGEFEFEASGHGISTKYEKPIEAEKRAEEDALSKAVRTAGVQVYSGFQNVMEEYGSTHYEFLGRYLNVWAANLVEYQRSTPPQCGSHGEIYECNVTIKGTVYYRGEADSNFELKAALDKPAYFDGDDVGLRMAVSKDSYLSVISCDEDGNAHLVFPNKYARDGFVKAGSEIHIPEDFPFHIRAFLPQNRVETGELLHVIATKNQPLFMLNMLKEEVESGFVKYSLGGLKALSAKLAKLQRSDWTSQVLFYEVKAK